MKSAETKPSAVARQQRANPSHFGKSNFFNDVGAQNHAAFFQAKLNIGRPDDIYEKEADSMADQVVRRRHNNHPAFIQAKCASCEREEKLQRRGQENGAGSRLGRLQRRAIFESNAEDDEQDVQRKCAACEEEGKLQKKGEPSGNDESNFAIERSLNSSKGSGAPLPHQTREQMESGLGADLSEVRIHNDSNAMHMSKALHAQAFTHGNDIYFNAGKYDVESLEGQHLLAHELTHTVQQNGASKPAQKKIQRWPDWVSDAADWVGDTASDVAGGVVDGAKWVGGEVADGARYVGGKVEEGVEWAGEQLTAAGRWIVRKIRAAISAGMDYLNDKWESIKKFGGSCFEDIKNGFGNLIHFITSPLASFLAALSGMNPGLLQAAWSFVKTGSNMLSYGIDGVINGVLEFGQGIWSTVSGFINNVFDTVAGLFDNAAFDLLPDGLQDEIRSVFNTLKSLWTTVSTFWTDLMNRLTETIRGIVTAVRSFVNDVIAVAIDEIIETVKKLKEVYDYITRFLEDPKGTIQPLIDGLAAKLNAEAPGHAEDFGLSISKQNYTAGPATATGGSRIQKSPLAKSEDRGTATLDEVIEGIKFYIKQAWDNLDIKEMIWDTLVNTFWPPATIKAIVAQFKNLWNNEWATTLDSLFAPRNFFDDPIGCIHDVWSNFLILLEFPVALWRTLNNVIGLLMGYITIIVVIVEAVLGGIAGGVAGEGVGAIPGAFAGAMAGFATMAPFGEALMASFILAEGTSVALDITRLFTARQTCEKRQKDILNSVSSFVSMGVALTLQFLMEILADLVTLVSNAIRGIEVAPVKSPIQQPGTQPALPAPGVQPGIPQTPVPQPVPVTPAVPATPAAPAAPVAPAVPGGGKVIPFPGKKVPAPVSPQVPGQIAAKFENGADTGNGIPDIQTLPLAGATGKKVGIDPDKCKKKEIYHKGTFDDPIPINWYKHPQDYPQQISLFIDGAFQQIPMFSEFRVRRLRGDRRLVTIGVAGRNRFNVGRLLLKGTTDPRTGNPQRLFREILTDRRSKELKGRDADHVIDLQFGGEDGSDTALRNIWPLASAINKRPVPRDIGGDDWNGTYRLKFLNTAGEVDERPIGQLHGKWFVIIGFNYPPVPNPGGEG